MFTQKESGLQEQFGTNGEHELQEQFGTKVRAAAFYDNQMLDYLNPLMRQFIALQGIVFIATASANGECDSSLRAGLPGFVRVIDEKTLIYPEYRGNGVMASLGNIVENPHVGMLFVDFFESTMGLHINGRAKIVLNEMLKDYEEFLRVIFEDNTQVEKPERWVMVSVEEAFIHCSKHIPHLKKLEKPIHWGTDEVKHKGGDYFQAKNSSHQRHE